MKKKVNTDAIKNELEGSVFFPIQRKEQNQQEQEALTPSIQEVKDTRPLDPKRPRPQEVKGSRIIKTHTFEFYKDQVDLISDLAHADKKKGGRGSQSQLVRDAIDEYLQKRGDK